jgi:DNA-binding NarL/FixJ family response regulator
MDCEPISILLVDDNTTFVRIATKYLEKAEHIRIVGTARDGSEALRQAEALKPGVILLDLDMPGANGLMTIPGLRAVSPDSLIIILTLLDTNGYRLAALDAGADEFLSKAALHQDLLPTVRKLVWEGNGGADPLGGRDVI